MSGYVSKDQVIEWFRPYGHVNEGIPYYELVTGIRDMPDADVVPRERKMTKEKAIETLIASEICYRPIFSCDECPAYKRELCDCDLPTNEKVEQAIRVLRDGGVD